MSNTSNIHIVSFQVPYPADYGGAIDVFYKAMALKKAGYRITLHTFAYDNREYSNALLEIADNIHLYKRNTGILKLFSPLPYIVKSRESDELLANLLKDDAPILFEGAHTTYYLSSPQLKERKKFVRTHNIESDYYKQLATASHSIYKKLFFLSESWKLKHYEPKLSQADILFAITEKDKEELKKICPATTVELLPCFHNGRFEDMYSQETGTGDYVLYNGNLSVEENIKAALFLIEDVAPRTNGVKWIFAGKNPSERIIRAAGDRGNIEIVANPSDEAMSALIRHAAVNVLITFQATGIKLKLLSTLCNGGHCIVNSKMIEGSKLENLCTVADSAQEIISAIESIAKRRITREEIENRKQALLEIYDNDKNIRILTKYL